MSGPIVLTLAGPTVTAAISWEDVLRYLRADGWEPGEERDAVGRALWKKAPSRGMWIGVSVDKIVDVVLSLAYLAGVAPGVMLTRIAAGDGPAPGKVAPLSDRAGKILAAAGAYQAARAAEARAETSGFCLLGWSRNGIDQMPPAPRWADNAAIRLQFGPAADAVGALLDACEAPEVEALAERRAEARREHVEARRALTRIPAPTAGQERPVEEALRAAGFWIERAGAEWILSPKGGAS